MDYYPWWNEAQRKLADEAKKVADEVLIPVAERAAYKKRFPWEGVREMGQRGWFGAQIPAKYGGHAEEWGVTGAAILLEEAGRAGELWLPLGTTMFGGVHQIIHDGTEEQRQRWLPGIARGERLGAITMTEPYAGSDVAGLETVAVRDGDYYIVNGKKRFQTGVGAAGLYMTYARTSPDTGARAKYRHLTAFVIEKGTPGFHVERINDLMGFDGIYNGYLSFDDARVPASNRIGEEGQGWPVMMSGLNVERILNAAPALGQMREAIRYAVQHARRRVQFGTRTGDMATNQFKIADMLWKIKMARLITYYAAYSCDLGLDVPIEAATAKMFAADRGLEVAIDAVQTMGGNGATRSYPAERIMRDMKVEQIAAGTSEILKLLIYRQGLKAILPDLKVPPRAIDDELHIPMPLGKQLPRKAVRGEEDVLAVLAENYRVNPGLYMTTEDIKELLEVNDNDLLRYLYNLEEKRLVSLFRDRNGAVALATATYQGLSTAHPPEYYKYAPDWVKEEELF